MPRIENADDWDAYERLPYVMAAGSRRHRNRRSSGCLYWVKIIGAPISQVGPVTFWPLLPARTVSDMNAPSRTWATFEICRHGRGDADDDAFV